MKSINAFFILIIIPFLLCCENPLNENKKKTLLDFEFGMNKEEISRHIHNLRNSSIINNYSFNTQFQYHEFNYSFPIEDVNNDNKAESVIKLSADPYLTSIHVYIEPLIDSAYKAPSESPYYKLYNAFNKQYRNPSQPMKVSELNGRSFSEAIWEDESSAIRWFQWEGDKANITYSVKGELEENIKRKIAKEKGVIEVERKY